MFSFETQHTTVTSKYVEVQLNPSYKQCMFRFGTLYKVDVLVDGGSVDTKLSMFKIPQYPVTQM
jgi:hypothetical protein